MFRVLGERKPPRCTLARRKRKRSGPTNNTSVSQIIFVSRGVSAEEKHWKLPPFDLQLAPGLLPLEQCSCAIHPLVKPVSQGVAQDRARSSIGTTNNVRAQCSLWCSFPLSDVNQAHHCELSSNLLRRAYVSVMTEA